MSLIIRIKHCQYARKTDHGKARLTSVQLISSFVSGSSTSFHNLAKKAGTLEPNSDKECILTCKLNSNNKNLTQIFSTDVQIHHLTLSWRDMRVSGAQWKVLLMIELGTPSSTTPVLDTLYVKVKIVAIIYWNKNKLINKYVFRPLSFGHQTSISGKISSFKDSVLSTFPVMKHFRVLRFNNKVPCSFPFVKRPLFACTLEWSGFSRSTSFPNFSKQHKQDKIGHNRVTLHTTWQE